ncbi:2-hydroxy-acid oxidase [Erythrobacter sp. SG61-1L]|uniref:alpha-hydroxy acid oxidase n=1 Tax=Erythrobacter sp. SG61-1L TaxID=1603897 RepID=UPI0006C905E0|nr:alpha-hydroxy acid oxidase [Erythrobacter sp. SG61-1L]KPL66836.1 2-hydroxy-acid oxidase [Erythrobacter sp. SG61-1L]
MSEPLPPLAAIPAGIASLADYEARAAAHMAADAWAYLQEGTGDGITLAENRKAFARLRLLPRILTDLRGGNTALDLLGRIHEAPLLLGPVAYQRLAHPEGELATVRAATALGTGMVVSTLSSFTLEEIADAARGAAQELGVAVPPLWFQLYLQEDRAFSAELIQRAEAAGYEAVMLTVDASIKRATLTLPPGVDAANLRGMPRLRQTAGAGGRILFGTPLADSAPGWSDLAWVRSQTSLPLLLKGVMAAPDGVEAIAQGVDALVVSNHGGRVLDGMPSALDVMPAIADATGGRVPLLMDGGVRRGTDMAKALALGASSVLLGRPQVHALAVAGLAGVAHMLHMLRAELELTMAQLGCPTPGDISADRLFTAPQ